MGAKLVVLAVLVATGSAGGQPVETDAARLFHEMDFRTMEDCRKANIGMSADIEAHLRKSLDDYWRSRLSPGSYRIESGSACSAIP